MAKLAIQVASTSQTVNVFIQDSTSTTGAGKTGLVFNTSGLTAYYALPKAASVAITLATLAAVTSAYSSGGFKEIDATNMPGWYRLDLPDAAIASGRFVSLHLQGATGMAPCPLEIELTGWNNQDAVHGGLTCLPNTAVTTNASLLTSGTGTDQLSVTSGRIDIGKALGTAVTLDANNVLNVSTKYLAGTALTARDIGASVLLSSGTGTGQLDFTSGIVKANLTQILGTTLTETAGLIAAGFKQFFNIASPTSTMNLITAVTTTATATNLTNAPTAGDFTATMKTSLNAATPASVVGAVGSVTGNVGGNVNGNVVGSVASVTADVGITQAAADKVFGSSGAAMAELSAVPSATPSPRAALMLIFMALRNKLTTTASVKSIFNDAGTAITTKALADDGTTYTESKMA